MNIKEEIENDLKAIWKNERFSEFKGRPYLFPEIEANKDLLFIGINPSFNEKDLNINSYLIKEEPHKLPYFNSFNNFAKEVGASWTHIDLLFFRETQQNNIHSILKSKEGVDFVYQQLLVAKKLITYANPKIIIVCNALARLFLGKEKDVEKNERIWMNYDFVFNEEIGTFIWNYKPVFFSSMLSGQRALDLGSLERLKWHVKRTLQLPKREK